MNTTRKKRAVCLGAILGLTLTAASARANTEDSLTVTITPQASYGVQVDTTNTNLDLGAVGLNTATNTVTASTVTITSSYASTNLTLQGVMGGTGTPWQFASTNAAAPTSDHLGVWAVFTDTSVGTAASFGAADSGGDYWVGTASGTTANVVSGTPQAVGGTAGAGQFITKQTSDAGYKTMTNLPSDNADPGGSESHLFLGFKLPPSTTDTHPKLITFVLTAHG
jgi:hypothetical protein